MAEVAMDVPNKTLLTADSCAMQIDINVSIRFIIMNALFKTTARKY